MGKIKDYFELYQEVYHLAVNRTADQQRTRGYIYFSVYGFCSRHMWIISIGAALINFITIVFDLQTKINDRKMAFWLNLFDAFEPNKLLCSRFITVQDVQKLTIWL